MVIARVNETWIAAFANAIERIEIGNGVNGRWKDRRCQRPAQTHEFIAHVSFPRGKAPPGVSRRSEVSSRAVYDTVGPNAGRVDGKQFHFPKIAVPPLAESARVIGENVN